jgi:ppGpp synthetase/RelA/SpoT-type nucleotidyltranferase
MDAIFSENLIPVLVGQRMPETYDDRLNGLLAQYKAVRSPHQRLAKYICNIITEYCEPDLIQATEFRAKSIESFALKCSKLNDDGSYKYPDPLHELTDLAGVRAIVYLRDSVDLVCAAIRSRFDVIEEIDVGERVYSEGKFGYQSKHLVVRLANDRKFLDENKPIAGFVCEVQVRTLLQHAWAAIDHQIQYKSNSEIPLEIRKRFSALAGALELADRELQRIDEDAQRIREHIEGALESDLTRQTLTSSADKTPEGRQDTKRISAIRDLLKSRSYSEAIALYTEKIELERHSYTLYIGRAKARFLAGDTKKAFEDLDAADEIQASENSKRLRALFESGDLKEIEGTLATSTAREYADGLKRAEQALSEGDGIVAFEEYTKLQEDGYNKAFAIFGKAMACVLEGDIKGCRSFLSGFRIIPATPMSVNISALITIVKILEGESYKEEFHNIREALDDFPAYSLANSPIARLMDGLMKKVDLPALSEVRQLLDHHILLPFPKDQGTSAAA